ncbi:MAG: histidine kinase [Nocardiaceae bacterium]|nr:histidine kinase [Nocardiaceae bacterium]
MASNGIVDHRGSDEDGIMERLYTRLGWRIVLAYPVVFTLVSGWYVSLTLIIYVNAHVVGLSRRQVVDLVAWTIPVTLLGAALGVAFAVRACRPLRRHAAGEIGPEEAWHAVARLPWQLMRQVYLISSLYTLPAGLWILARVEGLQTPVIAVLLAGCAAVFAYALAAYSVFPLVLLRPVLRSIQKEFEGPTPPGSGIRVVQRLAIVAPALAVATAMFGAEIGVEWRQDPWSLLRQMIAAALFGGIVALPVATAFARSVNQPIADLIAGAKRIESADYTTQVPELTTDEFTELARSFNAAMRGLGERQKLAGEKAALLEEVKASRVRLVAAADESRKRIERNIHDGAQQQLVALALDLRLLEEMAQTMTTEQIEVAARQASQCAKEALADLRELAHGLHPAILTTDGLGPALSNLAARTKVPVSVDVLGERFAEPVETAAYFVAAEALANVAKYARATQASVSVVAHNDKLVVSVSDDGIGGAHAGPGSGLAGLADRLAAVDGVLYVHSPVSEGTTVVAEIPIDRSVPLLRPVPARLRPGRRTV